MPNPYDPPPGYVYEQAPQAAPPPAFIPGPPNPSRINADRRAEEASRRAEAAAKLAAEAAARDAERLRLAQVAAARGAKPTEDQSKAQTYYRLQANAERNYLGARDRGYDPTSMGNAIASWFDGVPVLDGLGPVIRDEASDLGRQAEMQWSDAQLKAVSGAASPEAEVRRNIRTYFPAAGQDLASIDPQMRGARQVAFDSARTRAGGLGGLVPAVPVRTPVPDVAFQSHIRLSDPSKPLGSREHPYLARDRDTLRGMARNPDMRGKWVTGPSGALVQIGTGDVDPRSLRDPAAAPRVRRPAPPNRPPARPRVDSGQGWRVIEEN